MINASFQCSVDYDAIMRNEHCAVCLWYSDFNMCSLSFDIECLMFDRHIGLLAAHGDDAFAAL